jgi:hypothetical protein
MIFDNSLRRNNMTDYAFRYRLQAALDARTAAAGADANITETLGKPFAVEFNI